MAGKNDGKIRCSFCGKTQDQVNRLISGPNGAFICDECIDICAEILEEEGVEGHDRLPAHRRQDARPGAVSRCYAGRWPGR